MRRGEDDFGGRVQPGNFPKHRGPASAITLLVDGVVVVVGVFLRVKVYGPA